MKKIFRIIASCTAIMFVASTSFAQNEYQYSVDLTKATSDQLQVELLCPAVTQKEIKFYLPRIVPGTYMNSNYGKYVHDLQAWDKSGKALPVAHPDDNAWQIKKADKLYRITYTVEDTWDSDIKNMVYPMCGTSFEENKNFIINTPGLFGYFDGMKKIPFHLSFTKPAGFYAATGLVPESSSATTDAFLCSNADNLYDSPIMFSVPDTATVKVGSTDVLVAIYSPHHEAHAKTLANHLEKLLMGAKDYLGGKLPVDKYAFIFYFNGDQPKLKISGAWEHSYSSFYAVNEQPEKEALEGWVDMASHEFFHIVTPLTISSREVKEFNFNETVLSKHLWLYEGSTEYYAHHVQVWAGLKTPEQFLNTLSQKITVSRNYYNDTLSFTELSKHSADTYASEYGNVYMKGALISACLDLYLLQLSNGQYGLKDLKHDLSVNYGKDKFFEDDSLFNIIDKLTFPGVKDFLLTYVQGTTPLPYEKFFSLAGVQFLPKETFSEFTIGGIEMNPSDNGSIMAGTKHMNDVGKALGYKEGDELVSINSMPINTGNYEQVLNTLYASLKEGDALTVVVKRKTVNATENVTLSAPAKKVEKTKINALHFIPNPTKEQLVVRNAWLNNHQPKTAEPVANPADVADIDHIVKALYDVISGPAGDRDWNRFLSLFHTDAFMAAFTPKKELRRFSPQDYMKMDAPFFQQYAFYEKEIGRQVNEFRNIAQVFTAYAFEASTNPPTKQRGINSLELVKENGRWYIISITWDDEDDNLKIPEKYISK